MKFEIILLIVILNYAEGFFGIYTTISCYVRECCEPYSRWMPLDLKKLEEDLNSKLHGQDLVKNAIIHHLRVHVLADNPKRALLISFNGMTGTGKNYVSEIIAESLFSKGMESKNVHLFINSKHFSAKDKIEEYKIVLLNKITDSVRECERSLFIFDEVHDMPETLLNVITSFAENHKSIDGVDYRKTIFIFLSNSGGEYISAKYLQIIRVGRKRESMTLEEFEDHLFTFKNDSFSQSKLVKQYLVTAYVAFLPFERKHVELCIQNLLKNENNRRKLFLAKEVMKMIKFETIDGLDLAKYGCKRIDTLLERLENNKNN